jgi:hypothetical protein
MNGAKADKKASGRKGGGVRLRGPTNVSKSFLSTLKTISLNVATKINQPFATGGPMQDVITIGRRLVPIKQIAFVEPFDPGFRFLAEGNKSS